MACRDTQSVVQGTTLTRIPIQYARRPVVVSDVDHGAQRRGEPAEVRVLGRAVLELHDV